MISDMVLKNLELNMFLYEMTATQFS